MAAGAHTFALGETLLEPQVLPPPPTRHALLAFLLALAAILHLGTAGWSEIHNGPEGYYAGAARELIAHPAEAGRLPHDPPLLLWLLLGSLKTFGLSAMAARVPIALASISAVAFTFLIGERLADYWRGFLAGLLHLCSLGMFVWGRLVAPEPLFAAILGAALFCAVCGYQRQRRRQWWFTGVWLCAGLAGLAKGPAGPLYLGAILLLLALPFREARLRFRQIFRWPGLLLFAALLAAWPLWLRWMSVETPGVWFLPFAVNFREPQALRLARFLATHLVWWFPAWTLILPGLLFAWRKIIRPHEFGFAEALPLVWMAVGFVPFLFLPARNEYHSVAMWSGLALWAACAWERMPPRLRTAGLAMTAAGALFMVAATFGKWLPRLLPAPAWEPALWVVASMAAILCAAVAVAAFFVHRQRDTLALTIVLLAVAPAGLSIAEAMVRFEPELSFASAVRFLEPRLGERGEVLFEGNARSGSSLRFYLDRPFTLVAPATTAQALERMRAPHPVYLIVEKSRLVLWQARLTSEFHVFHQEHTCGRHVILSNQP